MWLCFVGEGGGFAGGAPAGQVVARRAGRARRAHGMQHGGGGFEVGGDVVEGIGKGNEACAACMRAGRASTTGSFGRQGLQGEGKRRWRPR